MKLYRLLDAHGQAVLSAIPGTLGGHRRSRVFGRLACAAALRALARGGYRQHRVFFADAATALAAGYRPCAVCMREDYRVWKERTRIILTPPGRAASAGAGRTRGDRTCPPSSTPPSRCTVSSPRRKSPRCFKR